jgi:FKBP-type peptidyl-prolyl cis-trans isomerase FklB
MKLTTVLLAVFLIVSPVYAEEDSVLKTEKDKISYTIGVDIGKKLKIQPIELNPDFIARGVKDSLTDGKLLMTEQELKDSMSAFQKEFAQKQMALTKEAGEKNKREGEAFLAENMEKEGVVTTSSGLQYEVIREGTGKTPILTDTVSVHYLGVLVDDTEFDSSYRRGQPATFRVDGVISGWTEALQLMKEGAKWQLFIPANLAYGERNTGGKIGPNSTLIFEVELISVEEKAAE